MAIAGTVNVTIKVSEPADVRRVAREVRDAALLVASPGVSVETSGPCIRVLFVDAPVRSWWADDWRYTEDGDFVHVLRNGTVVAAVASRTVLCIESLER